MRVFVAGITSALCLLITACSGGSQAPAGIASQDPASTAVIRRLLSGPPPGTAVYQFKEFTVYNGTQVAGVFPATATVQRTSTSLTVTVGLETHTFPASATITNDTGTYNRYVYPNHPVPEDLAGMKPSYITPLTPH